jgi:hypothetical protein
MNWRVIMKLILIMYFIFLPIFLSGCKTDNSLQPSDSSSYLPVKLGNYWIYRTYNLDNFSNPIPSSFVTDSVVIVNTDSILGQKCWLFLTFRNGTITDSSYYINQNNIIYKLFNNKDTLYPGFQGKWYKIFDKEIDSWHLDEYLQYPFVYYYIETDTIHATYSTQVNAYFKSIGNQVINDSTWLCLQGNILVDNLIYARHIWGKDTTTIKQHTPRNFKFSFVKNVGIAMLSYDTYSVDIYTEPVVPEFKSNRTFFNGKRSYLLRYHLN